MSGSTEYEFPLNEKLRRLLRLEFLLARTRHTLEGSHSPWDSRETILHLIEILDALGRSDIKGEFITELDRHHASMERLKSYPEVDQQQLNQLLTHLRDLSGRMHSLVGQPGHLLRENEFIVAVRQRNTIPGGTCAFDLPSLHCWLQRPGQERQQTLADWFGQFSLLEDCTTTLLRLTRETGARSQEIARHGSFERILEKDRGHQLIRISMPSDSPIFPEISAGRHRLTVRFLESHNTKERPTMAKQDVNFRLALCGS